MVTYRVGVRGHDNGVLTYRVGVRLVYGGGCVRGVVDRGMRTPPRPC